MRWLDDTRTSYDTVAASYADMLRDALAGEPFQRGILALFAELVRARGDGPVADVGCGPGRLTAHLSAAGLDAFGVDLSPGMIEVARRDHPGLRFEVGTMTALDLPDASLTGLLSWFALIHVPDDDVPAVLAEFHRVLRPGGALLIGFHAGEGTTHKTEGYGGHPMNIHVHRRTPARVAAWLEAAGFTVEAEMVHIPTPAVEGGFVFARRPSQCEERGDEARSPRPESVPPPRGPGAGGDGGEAARPRRAPGTRTKGGGTRRRGAATRGPAPVVAPRRPD